MQQEIFKSSCWGCLRAKQDPNEVYICPQYQQHLQDYEKWEKEQIIY